MKIGEKIVATSLAGDFTIPKDINQKLVFIAGGIGITPFRSIVKYMIDAHEKRDVVLFYSNKTSDEVVYKNVFDGGVNVGVKTVYVATSTDGRIDSNMIKKQVPDFNERMFYLSGPHLMVTAFEDVLSEMGIAKNKIKIDYFPGFA